MPRCILGTRLRQTEAHCLGRSTSQNRAKSNIKEIFRSILQPDTFQHSLNILKWKSKFLVEFCAAVTSPAAAVPGEELGEDGLKRFVHGHWIVLAEVVSTGRAGVNIGFERALEAFLKQQNGFI